MELDIFRKNVMKTLPVKAVKTGMRVASKNNARSITAYNVVALRRDVGNVNQALGSYILGLQMTGEMKNAAHAAMGDVGADLVALAKVLKVKTPAGTKKVKLTGTRTAALLQLDMLTNDMLSVVHASVFAGPKMHTVTKSVVMPTKGGTKEMRDVAVIDSDAEEAAESERQASLRSLLTAAVDVYWRLCFDLFKETPAAVFNAKMTRLAIEFPGVEFEKEENSLSAHGAA